jgi:hypothetical protein
MPPPSPIPAPAPRLYEAAYAERSKRDRAELEAQLMAPPAKRQAIGGPGGRPSSSRASDYGGSEEEGKALVRVKAEQPSDLELDVGGWAGLGLGLGWGLPDGGCRPAELRLGLTRGPLVAGAGRGR